MDKVAKSVRPLTRRETPENLGVVGKVACPPRFRPTWGGDGSEVNVYQLLTARQSVIAIDAVPDTVRISGSARDWGGKVFSCLPRLVDKSQGIAAIFNEFDDLKHRSGVVYNLRC